MTQLTFVTPTSVAEFKPYREDVRFLQCFLPFRHWSHDELDAFIEASVGELTLVYYNGMLVASFSLELYRRSAELHGIVRPDLKKLLCPRSAMRVKTAIYQIIFHKIFVDLGKQVLVAKVPEVAKGALGFVRRWGFTKINKDRGETVYKLDQKTYLERFNGLKETKEGEGSESCVSLQRN